MTIKFSSMLFWLENFRILAKYSFFHAFQNLFDIFILSFQLSTIVLFFFLSSTPLCISLGKVSKVSVATGDTDEVNLQKHKNTTSPNLIHSLDASLLHLATLKFDAPIALIHDSVLCRASDMGCLSYLIRETYMHMFAEQDYLQDWASQVGAQTEPPIIDTLQPESVIESTYFFC